MLYDKKILVTGGAGFIGSNLVSVLCKNNAVTVVDDLSEGHESNLAGLGIEFFKEDIRNHEFLEKLLANGFDYIFHLAASFANQKSIDYPLQDLAINGEATLKILECLSKQNSVFVYASSSCVYGNTYSAMVEGAKPLPETPYGITKLLGEYYTNFFNDYHGLKTSIVRYFNTYGPNEYPGPYRNVIPKFIDLALNKKKLVITGDGSETRDFTYVADAVNGTILAAENASGKTFNIGSGKETSILQLAELVNSECSGMGIDFQPKRTWDHISRRVAVIDRAKEQIAYVPGVNVAEGIKHTVAWFKKTKSIQ